MNEGTETVLCRAKKGRGICRYWRTLAQPVTQFLNDPYYLFDMNMALMKVYAIALLPFIALQGFQGFQFAESWYLWMIALLLLIPHVGISLLFTFLYVGAYVWNDDIHVSLFLGTVLVVAGIYFGIVTASLMHIATHRSIKPKWLNTLVGEICAFQQLVGVAEWSVAHILFHHRYPDDLENDPHPPEGQSYLRYALNMKFNTAMFVNKAYFNKWGQTKEAEKIWQKTGLSILAVGILRVSLWFVLLGPLYFMLFYIPSQIASMLLYTHFNYFTHRPDSNGKYVPINCENRGLIRILNTLTFGAYYHKNHHENPGLFNPKYTTIN